MRVSFALQRKIYYGVEINCVPLGERQKTMKFDISFIKKAKITKTTINIITRS